MWPQSIRDQVLVLCGRHCCICHKFAGTNIELHHIVPKADGGAETLDNCIPLCFDCHAEVGHYNANHPKGTKFSAAELRGHRDKCFAMMSSLAAEQQQPAAPLEVYEGQLVELSGFLWQEAFPGRPGYESLETDERELCWMLMLPHPITLVALAPEHGDSYRLSDVKRVQLVFRPRAHGTAELTHVRVRGKLWPPHTGHHHGQAMMDVAFIAESHRVDADGFYPARLGATHAPIPKLHGLTYDAARARLIDAGWQPYMHHYNHGYDLYGTAKQLWDKGNWEVDDGSGTGLAHCTCRFRDAYGNVLVVVTAGEFDPGLLGSSPGVWSWSLEEKT